MNEINDIQSNDVTQDMNNQSKEYEDKDVQEENNKGSKKTLLIIGMIIGVLVLGILIGKFFLNSDIPPTGAVVAGSNTEINAILLNDERCKECDTAQLKASLESVFPGITFEEQDYSSKEGKNIYEENEINALPAILLSKDIEKDESFENIEQYLIDTGSYYSLKIGATFDPEAEICDNEIDDTGNGKIDCEDEACSSTLTCNPDAITNCVEEYGATEDTVIFYYSNSCGWCAKMKLGVEQLQEEGYNFKWVEGSDIEESQIIQNCFREYMTSGGVPQFICVKDAEIHVGAFTDEERNLDVDALRAYADACIAK